MKRPRKVRISGHDWKITYHKKMFSEDGKNELLGCVDIDGMEICILKGMQESRFKEVLWHEILHAVCSVCSIKMTEREVDLLSRTQVNVMKDNGISFYE